MAKWSLDPKRIFLLSPAYAGGRRASYLLREGAHFALAQKLREGRATIGEIYTFMSGLYFRGKIAYVEAFGSTAGDVPGALVIVPGVGLVSPSKIITIEDLRAIGAVEVAESNPAFRHSLVEAARVIDQRTEGTATYVLLGSVASAKYTEPLLEVFGDRLLFPTDFVGRGDMSRGGLMLRSADSGIELPYLAVQGSTLRGVRPARLERKPGGWKK